jgi:hypothetical protein
MSINDNTKAVDVLFKEYNNLWYEKLLHKQSIRKFQNYITYLLSMGSIALAFKGVSMTDIFKESGVNSLQFVNNVAGAIYILFVPFTPVVCIIITFIINDMFQIYVMGTQIGYIERRINALLGNNPLLSWEHRICPVVFGGAGDRRNGKYINLIRLSNSLVYFPMVVFVSVLTSYYAAQFLWCSISPTIALLYVFVIVMFVGVIANNFRIMAKYTKSGSDLSTTIGNLSGYQQTNNPAGVNRVGVI